MDLVVCPFRSVPEGGPRAPLLPELTWFSVKSDNQNGPFAGLQPPATPEMDAESDRSRGRPVGRTIETNRQHGLGKIHLEKAALDRPAVVEVTFALPPHLN